MPDVIEESTGAGAQVPAGASAGAGAGGDAWDGARAPARIIRIIDGAPSIVDDAWRVIDGLDEWDEVMQADEAAGVLVPLDLALAQLGRLHAGRRTGIWLAPADEPARAAPLLASLSLVGVQFPKFTDGRGYSTAVLLRTRLGWRGELRALGDVLQDQLFALRRVGFDSFALRPDRDLHAALRSFSTFTDVYQGSVDQPLPAFRRGVAGP